MSALSIDRVLELIPAKYHSLAKQFLKFGVTGTIGAIVDFGTYTLLTRVLDWEYIYHIGNYPLSTANSISVFLAIISNFFFNKYWTFRHPQGNIATQWLGFLSISVLTWSLNQILMSYFTFRTPLFEDLFGDQKDLAAKVVAIGLIMVLNFLSSKFLIFRK